MKTLFLTLAFSGYLFALSNLEVAQKADAQSDDFISSQSSMKMTLVSANNEITIRQMQSQTLEGEQGDKSLITFLTPLDVRDTKLLTYEHINDDDDQWMYLPALKRVKKIASRNKSGAFMASEFSYEDIANQHYEKFTYLDNLQEVILDGMPCYLGTRIPKDANSGYTKEVVWIEKDLFLVKRIDYYDKKKELLKSAFFSGYQQLEGVWRVGSIKMVNYQNSKSTLLEWTQDAIKVGLSEKDFNQRVLKP